MSIVEQEEWRAIPSASGYEASSFGRIRSLDRIVASKNPRHPNGLKVKGRILKPSCDKDGYLWLNVNGRSAKVHKLVSEVFLGPTPPGLEINHKDGVKANCRSDNFEFSTHHRNILHSIEIGLRDDRGEANWKAKLTDEKVREIRAITGRSLRDIANQYGVGNPVICRIRQGKSWKHLLP